MSVRLSVRPSVTFTAVLARPFLYVRLSVRHLPVLCPD